MNTPTKTAHDALRVQVAASTFTILSFMLVGCLLWNRLPSEVPIHFNWHMQPDDYASKTFMVFGMPGILAAMHILCVVSDFVTGPRSGALSLVVLWSVPAVSVCVLTLLYAYALGMRPNVALWTQLIVGAILIIVGNVMPKSAEHLRLGRYTDRLTADDKQKIARFWGYCLMAGGIVICASALAGSPQIMLSVTTMTVALPWTYAIRRVWDAEHRKDAD